MSLVSSLEVDISEANFHAICNMAFFMLFNADDLVMVECPNPEMTDDIWIHIKKRENGGGQTKHRGKPRKVDEETYWAFIKKHFNELATDICAIWEPEMISHFWLDGYGIAASRFDYSDNQDDRYYTPPEERQFIIYEDSEESE